MTRRETKTDSAALSIALVTIAAILVSLTQVFAGEADVVDAKARRESAGEWRFDVTVRHADEGWDHYADKWIVAGTDGAIYGERVLTHPHVDEQPFTRSQSGIVVPRDIAAVVIRAHDSVHGFGGAEFTVDLDALR
ncbi:hypothetical protein [Oricola sp.]|uniref:hypothetical protein n=1 Tax=Oricola sp. TaxID=1979950 RepID=UPI0025E05259|nr:hypothetical protein [Oricola sp.]MCI5075943.1 hypothetical protein [Oricola sp.]